MLLGMFCAGIMPACISGHALLLGVGLAACVQAARGMACVFASSVSPSPAVTTRGCHAGTCIETVFGARLLRQAPHGGRLLDARAVQEHKVRDAVHAVLGHLRRPLGVLHVQHDEVDAVRIRLLHLPRQPNECVLTECLQHAARCSVETAWGLCITQASVCMKWPAEHCYAWAHMWSGKSSVSASLP